LVTYIYDTREGASSHRLYNNVTVARALNGKQLNKTIYANGDTIPYDNVYHYKFFNVEIETLSDLSALVRVLLAKPQSCIIRGVCKDDSKVPQLRRFHGIDATIIEQEQNWFAIDVDGYGTSTGDLRTDAEIVLLALGLEAVECFAIPSASYSIKPGINLRMFFWNETKISCLSLKKHFARYDKIVDLALFHPVHLIYIARPTFVGRNDPCLQQCVWLSGQQMTTAIVNQVFVNNDGGERKYTRKQAESFFNKFIRELPDVSPGERHDWLFNKSVALGKWIAQELLDEDEIVDRLSNSCMYYWRGDSKRDLKTITDAIQRGKTKMERDDEF
jgi:hypothetical protein